MCGGKPDAAVGVVTGAYLIEDLNIQSILFSNFNEFMYDIGLNVWSRCQVRRLQKKVNKVQIRSRC